MPKETNDDNLGVSIQVFEAGIEVLKRLADDGRFMLFLPRVNWLRIIGDKTIFYTELAKEVESSENWDESIGRDTLREIRTVLAAAVRYRNSDRMLHDFLVRFVFETESDFEDASDELKEALNRKVECVRDRLPVSYLGRRASRLETAGSRCLEDLDVDVVRERRDEIEDTEIHDPFLRPDFLI